MGGNALKKTYTRRYNKDEYEQLKNFIIGTLRGHEVFKDRKINDIQAYKEKETFGDMDLLVSSDKLPHNTWDIVKNLFTPNQLVRNGSVTSFDVNELQIDMILAPDNEYDISAIYFSYNDLGNLMGRVAHKMGFIYGHDGLSYTVRDENKNVVDRVHISMTPTEIFAFLGYDYDTYAKGFNNLTDIFKYTVTTQYFNKDYYNLETRNYASRIRDKKRATYRGFLEWIETQDNLPNYDYEDKREFQLNRAFAAFPGFKKDYDQALEKYHNIRTRKSKFNGQLVTKLTTLSGDMLGQWIQGYMKSKPDFDKWILQTSSEEIQQDILSKYKNNEITLYTPEKPIYGRDTVRDITGFDGRKLTMFMNDFRQAWPDKQSFYDWLHETGKTEIKDKILNASQEYNYEP